MNLLSMKLCLQQKYVFIYNIFNSMASKPIISAVLEPVLSLKEKSCLASYHRQFSMNNKIKIIQLILGDNKTDFILIIFILISAKSYLQKTIKQAI